MTSASTTGGTIASTKPEVPSSSSSTATPKRKKPRRTKLLACGMDVERVPAESKRQAAVVLEVLAGVRVPEEAADALGISVPTFYNLETRALRGLVHGCTPEPPGRKMALEKRLRELELEKRKLEQQLQRHRALLRSTQRAGDMLIEPPKGQKKSASSGGTKRTRNPRKPRVRALRAIEALATTGTEQST
jgi:hypothetical protein